MTKVFFHFYDENTSVEYRISVLCSPIEWGNWYRNDIELDDSFVEELDEIAEHNVHDWEEENGTFYIGFSSREATNEETLNTILSKWKEKLVQLNWVNENDEFIQTKE